MNKNKRKILIVTQYFWPENMRINDLVSGLIKKGHEVTILTGLPNYPDGKIFSDYKQNKQQFSRFEGATIHRVPIYPRGKKRGIALILNYLSFFISASILGLFKVRKQSFDSIFVYAVSPIMAAIPAIIIGKRKKAPVFIWVLDLWPETLSALGVIKNKMLLNSIGKLVSWIYNSADYLLLQSMSFKSSVFKYCTKPIADERVIYFPSWAEDVISNSQDARSSIFSRDDSFFTIMFAGNIGGAQNLPSILNVFEQLKENLAIRLVIVGDGQMLPWVEKQKEMRQLNNVYLLGRHPLHEMPGLFSCADALLVSLQSNEVFSKTIPGKLQAYLATGKPVIGMIDGEAAHIINESGCGLVGASDDEDALINNINQLVGVSLETRLEMGKAGVEYYKHHFESKKIFDKLENLIKSSTLRADNVVVANVNNTVS